VKKESKKPKQKVVRKSKNENANLWTDFEKSPLESDLSDLKKWLGG